MHTLPNICPAHNLSHSRWTRSLTPLIVERATAAEHHHLMTFKGDQVHTNGIPKLCKHWDRRGTCSFGKQCPFVHGRIAFSVAQNVQVSPVRPPKTSLGSSCPEQNADEPNQVAGEVAELIYATH